MMKSLISNYLRNLGFKSMKNATLPSFELNITFWRRLALLQIAILLGLLIYRILKPNVTPPSSVTLSLLIPSPAVKHWKNLANQFHKENPNIRLNLIQGPFTTNEVEAIYAADFQKDVPSYDLIDLDMVWVPKFAQAGWLRDLSGEMSKTESAQFLKSELETSTYQGKLYRIPLQADAGILLYRKDLLLQAGFSQMPKSLTELQRFQDLKQKFNIKSVYLWQGKAYEGLSTNFIEVLGEFGGFWVNSKTMKVGLDEPPAIKAATFLHDTIYKYKISSPEISGLIEDTSFEEFKNQNVPFLRTWTSFGIKSSIDKSLQNKVGIQPLKVSCKGGWGLSIAKNSQHPQEAWKVIQFFTSEKAQRQFLESGYLPTRTALFKDKQILKQHPYLENMQTVIETSASRPLIPEYEKISTVLQKYLAQMLLSSSEKPNEVMKKAAQETRKLLQHNEPLSP